MRELRAVIRKEFVHIRRDPRLIGYVVGLPVILLLLFGFALRLTIDELTVAVWDQDQTFFSLQVKDHLREDPRLTVVEVNSEDDISQMLRLPSRLTTTASSRPSGETAAGSESVASTSRHTCVLWSEVTCHNPSPVPFADR